jgi:3,4-dihydroxy 2-butanone 4-phosphate synthase/GTP cyclohydrolase II
LETKREKMGHIYGSDSGLVNGLIGENDNSTTGSLSDGV